CTAVVSLEDQTRTSRYRFALLGVNDDVRNRRSDCAGDRFSSAALRGQVASQPDPQHKSISGCEYCCSDQCSAIASQKVSDPSPKDRDAHCRKSHAGKSRLGKGGFCEDSDESQGEACK